MNRLLVVALFIVISFGSNAGFDAGGGGGKIAIALRNKVIHREDAELNRVDSFSLGIQHFSEVVKIDSADKVLSVNTAMIAVADLYSPRVASRTLTPSHDSLEQFKQMADEGDVTVLLIDFKSYTQTPDGKLVLKLKEDWGTSLKVYQISQGGIVVEQDSQNALDFKTYNEVETTFSVHLILDEINDARVNRDAE